MKYSFNQSVLVGVLMAVLVGGMGILALIGIGSLVETAQWVDHTQVVIDRLQTLLTEVEEDSTAMRSYFLTGNTIYLQVMQKGGQIIPKELAAIKKLTSDNPERQNDLAKLQEALDQHLAAMKRLIEPGKESPKPTVAGRLEESDKVMGRVKAQISSMQADERRLLQERSANTQRSSAMVKALILAGSVIGLAVLLGNTLSLRREMKLRGRAEETLRQSEERTRLMIEGVKDYSIIMLDPDGRIVNWNAGAERLKGYRAEEIIGRHFSRFYPEEQIREGFPEKELEEAAENGRFEDEAWRMRKDGTRFWADVVLNAVRNERGELLGFVKLTRDATVRKETAERIQKLNDELKQRAELLEVANKELESFSYSVSHDLRAPLRHIHGFVEILQKAPAIQEDGASRRQLSVIARAAKEMGRLIDDLLAFSRTSRAEMHPIKVDMREMIDQIILDRTTECEGRRIAWEISPLSKVAGDPNLLRLVWTNLLDNALKYTRPRPEAKIEIGQITGVNDKTAGQERVFYVRDNGVGFDMRYAAKLFGVFQRLHRAEDFEGTGIGLANVQRIIHRHGGRVWAEGKIDSGATFYFSLPITVIQPV